MHQVWIDVDQFFLLFLAIVFNYSHQEGIPWLPRPACTGPAILLPQFQRQESEEIRSGLWTNSFDLPPLTPSSSVHSPSEPVPDPGASADLLRNPGETIDGAARDALRRRMVPLFGAEFAIS